MLTIKTEIMPQDVAGGKLLEMYVSQRVNDDNDDDDDDNTNSNNNVIRLELLRKKFDRPGFDGLMD
jgi:hypothetical protein